MTTTRRRGGPYGLALALAAAFLSTNAISGDEEVCEGGHTTAEAETVDPYSPPIRQLLHEDWETYTIDQLFEEYYECAKIIYGYDGKVAAAGDEDDEENYNRAWAEHVRRIREQLSKIREKYDRENINNDAPIKGGSRPSSMLIPFEVGDAGDEKGRGIFAKESVQNGQLVIDLDNGSVGYFKNGHEWRKFTVELPREVACNFIEWSWVQDMPRKDDGDEGEINDVTDARDGLTIFVAYDESNLINSAEWGHEEANVACGSPPENDDDDRGPCRYKFYATRDIKPGEELLINYSEFEKTDQTGWEDIGL